MRQIKHIFVHCTAGSQKQTVEDLMAEFKAKGWHAPGYHYVIAPDGKVTKLLDTDKVSNGVKGYNSNSINVAYIGGIDENGRPKDTRTFEQKKALLQLLKWLKVEHFGADIMGHRDISPDKNGNGIVDPWERIKECPCFDAKEEYKNL